MSGETGDARCKLSHAFITGIKVPHKRMKRLQDGLDRVRNDQVGNFFLLNISYNVLKPQCKSVYN